ncbi:LysR family transcriptional regulator [Bosea sp. ASV33]|uniref:LysR family transcriptional regulator n=1 Tax=Bosea sp. ASV33 TaxID=2795106 RepID=UPI0018ED19E0|nr:LysR family transcriptional regulator [Bosea sp. ASV33]
MLDPRLLRSFVAIADTGSFTQAAERLNMTQSTISQQLARLEEAVGRGLIDRVARPVRATASGERLLGYARRILTLQQEAETMLGDSAGTASIRIGVPDDIVTGKMAQVFASFTRQYREIRLDVVAGLSRELTRRYRAGEFDVVIVKEPSASADHRASFPEAMAWFESIDAPESWPEPLPLVTFPPGGLYRDAMFERIERERHRWYIALSSSNLYNVIVAIEAGLGLSLLPVGTTIGRRVRPYAPFGMEPAMVVSIYSWEKGGLIAELVAAMSAVLAQRYSIPGQS